MAKLADSDIQLLEILKSEIGPVYGSQTLAMLLHVLALREKPMKVLELGTGLGTTTAWIASAMAQNGLGKIVSIDNGAHFPPDPRNTAFVERFRQVFPDPQTHPDYMTDLKQRLSFGDRIEFYNRDLNFDTPDDLLQSLDVPGEDYDWVFCDVTHGPRAVEVCLAAFLSISARCFSLFIDSASTYTQSFLVSERMIEQLNRGKVPDCLNEFDDPARREFVRSLAQDREFRIHHFTEQADSSQNATMLIQAFPVDSIPYPATFMRDK